MADSEPAVDPPPLTASRPPLWLVWAVLLLGVGLRVAYVHRPFDHRIENPWRQADYFQIAKNFHEEQRNILYPRIDWRGDTPGYAEMEFPLLPWLGGLLFGLFEPKIQVLRSLAAAFEIAALLLFAALARRLLSPWGMLLAMACFAVNPILLLSASSPQPDPVMHCFSLGAMLFAWRWYEGGGTSSLLAASLLCGLAILAKLPAAYLGLVLAYLVIRRLGSRALGSGVVWPAALIAISLPAAWYLWVHRFWTLYGNSLGVSNETHAIGLDMVFPPSFLLGILKVETLAVFSPAGWLLALVALRRPRAVEFPLIWYGAAMMFYVAAARTAADGWAYYYHGISVAPACLLVGAGAVTLWNAAPAVFLGVSPRWRRLASIVLAVICVAALLGYAGWRIYRRDTRTYGEALYRCSAQFRARIPPGGRIVVRGGTLHDEYGRPVAHNESMAFVWLDRRGFSYADEELSLGTLADIVERGGRYWIVTRGQLRAAGLDDEAAQRYRLLQRCGDYLLYELAGDVSRGDTAVGDLKPISSRRFGGMWRSPPGAIRSSPAKHEECRRDLAAAVH